MNAYLEFDDRDVPTLTLHLSKEEWDDLKKSATTQVYEFFKDEGLWVTHWKHNGITHFKYLAHDGSEDDLGGYGGWSPEIMTKDGPKILRGPWSSGAYALNLCTPYEVVEVYIKEGNSLLFLKWDISLESATNLLPDGYELYLDTTYAHIPSYKIRKI